MKIKPDYCYYIVNNLILIKDLNLGNISVTNSIEFILSEIQKKTKANLKEYRIIQQDSENELSEVKYENSRVYWIPIPSNLKQFYLNKME